MVNYWILKGWSLVLLGILPIPAGVAIALQGWFWRQDSAAFLENLRQTEGRIVRFTPLAGALRIDVEYTDENGVLFQKPFVVDEAQEPELRAAGKISMVHDSREPRRAEVGHVVSVSNTFLAETAVLAAGLLVMLAGFCYVAKCARQVIQTDRLFRYGQIVETEVRDAAMAPGKETGRFTYAFRGSNGRWFEGKSPELPSAKLKAWPVGRTVLAVYDPMDPRRTEADIFGVLAGRRRDLPQTA